MSWAILILETLLAPIIALTYLTAFAVSPRRKLLATLAQDLPQRLGLLPPEGQARLAGRQIIWLHAASAGEVKGLTPLIARLAQRPKIAVLVTSTNPAGREAARKLEGVAWAQLAPLDAWPCLAYFLKAVRPARLILSETELWPSTLILAARAGLRPVLINARLTAKSLARYRWMRPLLAPALASLTTIGAQSEEDLRRFESIGVPEGRGKVTGNTKYDVAQQTVHNEAVATVIKKLGWMEEQIFVAGSTHPVEEDAVINAFLKAQSHAPRLRLVLAPRHLERLAQTEKALSTLKTCRWSKASSSSSPENPDVLLIDAMGLLPAFYARALAAFVGGTLVSVGGHNLLEPALSGVPVIFGPHTEHVTDVARLLERGRGGLRVSGASELAQHLSRLAADPAQARALGKNAAALSASLRGATERTLALIELI